MKGKRKKPLLRTLRWAAVLLVLLLLVGGAALLLPIFGEPILSLRDLLFRREERFSSEEILAEIRDLSQLQTVEYVYRMVFPHDFYTEGITLSSILDRLAAGGGSAEEILSQDELLYLRAHNLAAETGLATGPDGDAFVVVTARVRAGYNLDQPGELFTLQGAGSSRAGGGEDAPPPLEPGAAPEETRVVVRLPEAEVVRLIIEDLGAAAYPYPEARVDAEEWRAISSFVGGAAELRTVEAGILEEARENTRQFLAGLLEQAGFAEVRFAAES